MFVKIVIRLNLPLATILNWSVFFAHISSDNSEIRSFSEILSKCRNVWATIKWFLFIDSILPEYSTSITFQFVSWINVTTWDTMPLKHRGNCTHDKLHIAEIIQTSSTHSTPALMTITADFESIYMECYFQNLPYWRIFHDCTHAQRKS